MQEEEQKELQSVAKSELIILSINYSFTVMLKVVECPRNKFLSAVTVYSSSYKQSFSHHHPKNTQSTDTGDFFRLCGASILYKLLLWKP